MADQRAQSWKRLERAYKRRIRDLENALRNARLCAGMNGEGGLCPSCVETVDRLLRLARPVEETSGSTDG